MDCESMRGMRLLLLAVMAGAALVLGCGNSVGNCTAPVATAMTTADGGSVSCLCQGPCGCFYADGGRCP